MAAPLAAAAAGAAKKLAARKAAQQLGKLGQGGGDDDEKRGWGKKILVLLVGLGSLVFAPFLIFVMIAGALLGLVGGAAAAANCAGTQVAVNGQGANLAAEAMYNAGLHDSDQLTLMVAIAGSISAYNPNLLDSGSGDAGLWQIPPPAPDAQIQYLPPDAPANFLLDPVNNADAAFTLADGPGLDQATTQWAYSQAMADFEAAKGTTGTNGNFAVVNSIKDAYFPAASAAVTKLLGSLNNGAASTATDGTPTILGVNTLSQAQIVTWWYQSGRANPPLPVSLNELVGDYISEGQAEGVRGDMAFAQAIEETAWFTSSYATQDFNFAGIGVSDSNPHPGVYPSVLIGVRAHIQLLKKVVSGNHVALANPDVSMNWGGKTATTWGGLAANWASDPTYGSKLMKIYNSMLASAGLSSAVVQVDATCATGGSTSAIEQSAQTLNDLHLYYVWGGGHNGTPAVPSGSPAGLDCSGAVSYVLQHAGIKVPTMVSTGYMTWGDPGPSSPGGVTIYASPNHVFMEINGRFFASDGAGLVGGESPDGPQWRSSTYLQAEGGASQWAVRHVPGT